MFELVVLVIIMIAALLGLVVTLLWFISIVGSGAPFVPVPWKAVPGIVNALELKKDSVVYDMGCGDGRILSEALKKMPSIQVVGIEKAFLPYVLSKFRLHSTNARVVHGDFFNADLRDATHVVLYLFPELMGEVEEKLKKELRPGTTILAVDFSFKDKTPVKTVEQDIKGLRRGTVLRLYTFS
jgi:trans-aconitate methyltransferase